MVRKSSTVKKSASHKSLKKSSSHSHASHHAASSSGFKMFAHCLQCKCKVNINDCKYVMFKGKGSTMRTRIEGVCEKGHKFNRFAKSSDAKSSKTMKGGENTSGHYNNKNVPAMGPDMGPGMGPGMVPGMAPGMAPGMPPMPSMSK